MGLKIRHKVVAHQPKVKRDKTGSISFGTMLELSKEQFDQLNDAYYNGEELFLFIASEDDVVDLITEIAKDLTTENN